MNLEHEAADLDHRIGADPLFCLCKRACLQDADATNLAAELKGVEEGAVQYQLARVGQCAQVGEMRFLQNGDIRGGVGVTRRDPRIERRVL